MWKRLQREILVEYYWWKRRTARHWKLSKPSGLMGILALALGLFLTVFLSQTFAAIIRSMIPWVGGDRIAETYWSSVVLALKLSLFFILFAASLVGFIGIRFFGRRK